MLDMIEMILLGLVALFCLLLGGTLWYMSWRLKKMAGILRRMGETLKPYEEGKNERQD